jgi:hypothetical protein
MVTCPEVRSKTGDERMEHTLKLQVPDGVYEPLIKAAKQAGRTPEELAREWLETAVRTVPEDPIENFIGTIKSNVADWADQHDNYIRQNLIAQMQNTGSEGD